MSKSNTDRRREIKDVNTLYRIRASTNLFSNLKSKKVLFFPTELYAKILAFEKLHK